ncbi:hypothetical protein ACH49O_03465 [Streptomyces coeruleorubidus]|uniref:hypothetical protein n=1 Tax=Streptomyces coeruleorubidus TaxID=116188 RepID=UPI0033EC0AC4
MVPDDRDEVGVVRLGVVRDVPDRDDLVDVRGAGDSARLGLAEDRHLLPGVVGELALAVVRVEPQLAAAQGYQILIQVLVPVAPVGQPRAVPATAGGEGHHRRHRAIAGAAVQAQVVGTVDGEHVGLAVTVQVAGLVGDSRALDVEAVGVDRPGVAGHVVGPDVERVRAGGERPSRQLPSQRPTR